MKNEKINKFIGSLDRDKLNILFFNYSLRYYWYHPLMLITKLYYFLSGKPKIDHVCHISRWCTLVNDNAPRYSSYGYPQIFEANLKRGMIENDLAERLKKFEGTIYCVQLDNYDKNICRNFENEFRGKPYDAAKAVGSAVDNIKVVQKIVKRKKQKGYFCSYLVLELLVRHGYRSAIDLKNHLGINNVAPYELFEKFYHPDRQIRLGVGLATKTEKIVISSTKNLTFEEMEEKRKNKIIKILTTFSFLALLVIANSVKNLKNEIKTTQEKLNYNAFNYQQKEQLIVKKLTSIFDETVPKGKKIYISLVSINQEKNKFVFSEIISYDKKNDEIVSYARTQYRETFELICNVDNLNKSTYIPKRCINFLPNSFFIEQSHGIIYENYIIAITSYLDFNKKEDAKENYQIIKNIIKKIKKEF